VTGRRTFLALLAPATSAGFVGRPLAASYDLRSRTTTIYFESDKGVMSAGLDHDTMRVSRPRAATLPDAKSKAPGILLKLESGHLAAHGPRGKFSELMTVPAGALLAVIYPYPAHPDLTAIWSIDSQMYFTNNDYRNVYELPVAMTQAWQKPKLRQKQIDGTRR